MRKAPVVLPAILILLCFCLPAVSGAGSFDSYLIAKSESRKYNQIAFDGRTVAWVEYGSGEADGPGFYPGGIYRYDIVTGWEELVLADTSWKRDLDLSGKRYAWSDGRGIFVYDEAQNLLTFLYSNADQYSPCIDGDTVLWVERSGREYSIAAYDLASGGYRRVASSMEYLGDPAISGYRAVFCERRDGRDAIVCLDLATGEGAVLCMEEGPRTMPAIDGGIVVWADGRGGPYQVYLYDLETGESGPVSPSGAFQMYPDISGGLVVWEDYRNSPGSPAGPGGRRADIRLYDRESNKTGIVIEGPFSVEFPRVSQGYVVWSDGRNNAHDIFLRKYSGDGRSPVPGGEGLGLPAVPTPSPTPDTKVRYYSTISEGEIEWYSLDPLAGDTKLSFELRWEDPASSLVLAVVSPGGSAWHFSDKDDLRSDQAVRMTISGVAGGPLEPGTWVVAVSGSTKKEPVPYDLCWY
jgi:beta propeller repeat protein